MTKDNVGATADDRITSLTYEQAREELAGVVASLESGQAPLADALALWERGERLATHCQQILDGAKTRVNEARAAAEK